MTGMSQLGTIIVYLTRLPTIVVYPTQGNDIHRILARIAASSQSPPSRRRNPEADDLDRLTASHHHLTPCCRKPAPDEAGEHPAAEAVAAEEHLLVDAVAVTREQLQHPLLFGACADYRHWRAPRGNCSPPRRSQNAAASSGLAKQNTTRSTS